MDTLSRLKWDARVRFLALIGILVLGNLLAHSWFVRADLTRDKVFSLSPATRQILDELDKPVEVRAYFTGDLQAPYSQYAAAVRDKLDEYVAYSGGKIRYEFKDPTGDPELEEEARRFGIFSVQVDYRDRDQREIRRAFMGVAFVSGEKQEALPLLKQLDSLEYDVTRSILAVTTDQKKKTVAFLTGHNEPDLLRPPPQGGVNPLRMALEEKYEVTTVNTVEDDTISDDVDVLIAFAPSQTLTDKERFLIDQYLMSGRSAGFFLVGHTTDPQRGQLVPIPHGFTDLLASYGFTVNSDLVIDRTQNGRRQFPVRQGRLVLPMLINYPLIPVSTDLNKDSVITRDLTALAMPFNASISIGDDVAGRDGASVNVLARSSEGSSRMKQGLPPTDPMALAQPSGDEEPGPFDLAVAYQGPLTSFFKGKDVPDDPGLAGRSVVADGPVTRLAVFGGAEWIQGNLDLFLNTVDWLALDERLISIRSRSVMAPPLEPVATDKDERERKQQLIKAANVAGLPFLVILFGLIRWRVRARRKS